MKWIGIFVVAFAIACGFAAARISGVTNDFFKDFAHIFIGILIGLGFGRRQWAWGILAIALTVVETAVFIIARL